MKPADLWPLTLHRRLADSTTVCSARRTRHSLEGSPARPACLQNNHKTIHSHPQQRRIERGRPTIGSSSVFQHVAFPVQNAWGSLCAFAISDDGADTLSSAPHPCFQHFCMRHWPAQVQNLVSNYGSMHYTKICRAVKSDVQLFQKILLYPAVEYCTVR